ncbi:MAG: hypothetical protein EHM79_14655, partial [Geobacter sp.]
MVINASWRFFFSLFFAGVILRLAIFLPSDPFAQSGSSRVRRADHARLIPLTEPYVRASYTAHAHSILIFEAV